MKVAVVGSRNLFIEFLGDYLPPDTTEIVSGGAKGIDACAREYALSHGLKLTEFLPEYSRYGRIAPVLRNQTIVDYADQVLVFWDGHSNGTNYTIGYCRDKNKPLKIYTKEENCPDLHLHIDH